MIFSQPGQNAPVARDGSQTTMTAIDFEHAPFSKYLKDMMRRLGIAVVVVYKFSEPPSISIHQGEPVSRQDLLKLFTAVLRDHNALLVKKDGMPEVARKIFDDLRGRLSAFYDESGSIGRRYRRQDEAGTPYCVTVDGQTMEDDTVTVRDRDTLKQERVATGMLAGFLAEAIG